MNNTVARIIGILVLAYVGYEKLGIVGVLLVAGLALCNKI